MAFARAVCHAGAAGHAGGGVRARHRIRSAMSARIRSPADLCTLNASARAPGGDFGIDCIHHPNANCPATISAIVQWKRRAIVV